jgi:hypothetical protein
MDGILFMSTIHRPDDGLVGFEVGPELAKIAERAPVTAKGFGKEYTFKLWECKEITLGDWKKSSRLKTGASWSSSDTGASPVK